MADNAHDSHEHGTHVVPWQLLVGVFGALIVLTIFTVTATSVDLGKNWNLALAMAIASAKATLVVLYFMHLRWDRLFHSVLFVGGLLTATLFVTFAMMDSGEYQNTIIWDPKDPPQTPYGPAPKNP